MMYSRPAALGVALLLGAAAQPPAASASDVLDEIIVTADFRANRLANVPASVSVLDRSAIQDSGVQHLEDLIGLVPNMNWSGETSRPRFLQLRGIGERSQYQGAPNPSVGFVVDDIDFSGIGMVATLFDVDQFEVLRGPQGTRYGANALAGLVYMRTRDPGDTFELDSELTVGNDGAQGVGLAFGGPVSDQWSYRLVTQRWQSDGFRENVYLGRSDTNQRDELTARGKLRYAPSDRLSLDLTAMLVDLDNGYDAWSLDNTFVTRSDRPGRDAQRSGAGAVRVDWRAADSFRLLSITTYADSDIEHSFDGDWASDEFWGEFGPYDFWSRTDRRRRTASQELRLVSEPGAGFADGRVEWLAGVYALTLDERNENLDLYNGEIYRELRSDYEATNMAAFGQLDIALSDTVELSAGLRAERRSADYADSLGVAFDPTENMLGGALTLMWSPGTPWSIYGSLSRGYKAGGFNIGLSIPEERRQFDTEYLWNLETGVKGSWLDGRLQSSVSVFHMRRRDQQVSTSAQLDPGDPLTFVFFTDNAARGHNYGAEGELRWRLRPSWTLFTNVGLLRSRYSEFVAGPEGREQAHAPRWQYATGLQYRDASGWFGRVEVTGRDAFYFSDSHDQRSQRYHLVNARFGWDDGRLAVYAWGRNLFDETYSVRGFFFGNEPPDFADTLYVRRGDPRHFGVTLRYRM